MILYENKYKNILSAPIAGYTNWPLRKLFSQNCASRIFSEMIHVREVLYKNDFEIPFLNINYNFTIQLFGSLADDFIRATEILFNYCDNVDINCGCPVKKVIKAEGGSFWLKDIDRFARKIYQLSEYFPHKISVKIRLGFNKIEIYRILDSIKNARLAFITIHMRTSDMFFSGSALYQYASLLDNYKIPVILNGDINDAEFAKQILDNYNCSGIMIGRAALSDPSIFKKIKDYIEKGQYTITNKQLKIDFLIQYIDNLLEYFDLYHNKKIEKFNSKNLNNTNHNFNNNDNCNKKYGEKNFDDENYLKFIRSNIIESRKILLALLKKIPGANNIKDKILKISNIEDLYNIKKILNEFKIIDLQKN
ncbi:MAG: tRNA dihydrouridine synthase [Exilispira sp.]